MNRGEERSRRLGLIVNPVAGLGGAVALKGTDGTAEHAMRLGATPHAALRTARALRALRCAGYSARVFTAGGSMGEDEARAAGFTVSLVPAPGNAITTVEDTQRAARAMAGAGVELLLFAGGDGTARDIFEVVGDRIPILGIPAGVKMHSAVFATSPASAGEVVRRFLMGTVRVEHAEVMDRDVSSGRTSPHLYGFARTPRAPLLTQYAKSTPRGSDDTDLRRACQRIADASRDQPLTIIGPGTTTRIVKQLLGFDGTLDGVDVTSYGRPIALDVAETYLLDATVTSEARLVVGVVGGQGYLLGRGNQQISAEVVRRIGRDHITIVAARSKLLALPDQCLFVDTGSPEIDQLLSGHVHVWVGSRERMIYRIQGGSECVPAS